MTNNRPTLMMTTPGITQKNLTAHPLGLESEMTVGDDQTNPYNSVQEAEATREVERKQEEHEDDKLFKTGNPVGGSDPFLFDDLNPGGPTFGDSDPFGLEALDPMNNQGPEW